MWGSTGVGRVVRKVFVKIAMECYKEMDPARDERKLRDEAERWFEGIRRERYATDVFD